MQKHAARKRIAALKLRQYFDEHQRFAAAFAV
jgi:hypothetical protein